MVLVMEYMGSFRQSFNSDVSDFSIPGKGVFVLIREMNHLHTNFFAKGRCALILFVLFCMVFCQVVTPMEAQAAGSQDIPATKSLTDKEQQEQELDRLKGFEEDLNTRNKLIEEYKGIIQIGQTCKFLAGCVLIAGIYFGIRYAESDKVDPKTGKKEAGPGAAILLGSLVVCGGMASFGNHLVKKGQMGIEGLGVSYFKNGEERICALNWQTTF